MHDSIDDRQIVRSSRAGSRWDRLEAFSEVALNVTESYMVQIRRSAASFLSGAFCCQRSLENCEKLWKRNRVPATHLRHGARASIECKKWKPVLRQVRSNQYHHLPSASRK